MENILNVNQLTTLKMDVEVNNSPQFVEIFLTYINPNVKRLGTNKEQFLISIPELNKSFFLSPSYDESKIVSILDNNGVPKEWLCELSKAIYILKQSIIKYKKQ